MGVLPTANLESHLCSNHYTSLELRVMKILFLSAVGILSLCPPSSPTSMGHPLPVPLQEAHLSPHPLGSSAPATDEEKAALPTPEDYYSDILELQTPEAPKAPSQRCDYNHCRHLQVPCSELHRVSGCLCPGITGPNVVPAPPRLETIHATEAGVSLHWCAPWSTVEEYQLLYQPTSAGFISGPVLNSTSRMAAVSALLPDTEYLFCIVASNQAGSSPTDDGHQERGPCRVVRTPARQMPYVYIAAGLASALVLVVISALVWHFFIRRKKPVFHGSQDNILDGERGLHGAANHTFRNEEQL
ncbi:LRRN4 C-terminal-like protein [Tiliqua scincoides]|uniref:LRRN4 C-terminal-like protein n=1 Tax=Tiliqua scincoides TaxID=71010 RepID=UPI003462047B